MTPELQSALAPFLKMAEACANLHDHEQIAARAIGGKKVVSIDARDFRALARAVETIKEIAR